MRKLVFGLILALVMSSLLFPAAAQADTAGDEAAFVTKINELRASKGLAPLQVNANLVAKARSWSAEMAAAGRIWHSTLSDGITENWRKLGENVGMGGSVDTLHRAFVNSPHHYENLIDPAFGHVGIGIAMSGTTIYVTEVFMQLMPSKTAPVVTVPTAPVTAPKPTTTTTAKPPAPKLAPKPAAAPAPSTTTSTSTTTTTTASPVAAEPPAPPVAATPVDPPRAPSALLVSVLERLRTFDS
ncbi:MAG TPA: CAP domain-containing protein [Acidimicrobiia bacterium]|nr:CAP domain-containing protein [Acidimicrobiia bacterium]